MKRIKIVHKEPNEDCLEVLKETIVNDKDLKKYRIDKNTLIQKLPENIVNQFLDFLGTDPQHISLMLYMIKKGSLVITCDEEE